jgi:hypothetical protein
MAKAILVIDVDEKHLGKEVSLIKFTNGNAIFCSETLKPLPQKKDCFEKIENVINQKINKKETDEKIDKIRSYSEGYNDCLDDILGGNNE